MDNSKDHLKHFPIDDSGSRIPNRFGDVTSSQPDELILFPLEQNSISFPPASISSSNKSQKTSLGSKGRSTTNLPRSSTHRSYTKSKPLSPAISPPSSPFISKRFIRWAIIIGLLIYFREEIISSKISHDIISWSEKNNPFGKNESDFNDFKKGKLIYNAKHPNEDPADRFAGNMFYIGELILIEKTGESRNRYILPKGVLQEMEYSVNKNKKTKEKIYVREIYNDIDEMLRTSTDLNTMVKLQEWDGGPLFYVPLKKIQYYEEVGIRFMYNSFESFQNDETDIIFLPAYYYDLLTSGQSLQGLSLKNIPTKKIP